MTPQEVYASLALRMPHHAGAIAERPAGELSTVSAVPAAMTADLDWLASQFSATAQLYGSAPARVLGVIWWYSASSVLVAPTVESLLLTDVALHPALAATTLYLTADGRFIGARSSQVLGSDINQVGAELRHAVEPIFAAIAKLTQVSTATLRAILTDSIANRCLWASQTRPDADAPISLAERLVNAIDPRMPTPRYRHIAGTWVTHRSSCCLIYQATGGEKCISCPHQTPLARDRRLRAAFS